MFSIKSSFADCSTCELLSSNSCILETNSKSNLSDVEVIFISDFPTQEECKKELPLIGKNGKIFRTHFSNYIKKQFKYLLTNTILCSPPKSNEKYIPSDTILKTCKHNCFNIIEQCNPKLIVLLGEYPAKVFGFNNYESINKRGQFIKWKKRDVLLTLHPNFINENKNFESKFQHDFITISEFLGTKSSNKIINKVGKSKNKKEMHRYKIPEKFYTEEYRLVDIQFLNQSNKVLYIFRDKNNKRIDHFESDEYIYYEISEGVESRQTVSYNQLNQISLPYKEKSKIDHSISYEGDIKICAKHAIDYYHYNKKDAPTIDSNIYFFDIEIDAGEFNREFPHANIAAYPINMIATIYQNKTICYVIENNREKIKNIEGIELKIFKNEKTLLLSFITDFKKSSPDYIAGWNIINFDLQYILNRLPKLGMKITMMSKYNEVYIDPTRFNATFAGVVVADQLNLYKTFTFVNQENNQLNTIAKYELGISKIEMEYPINEMYYKDINNLIKYNIRDTELLKKIEDKVKHISLLNEIRLICNGSFKSTAGVLGQIDCIILSYLKKQGVASKNGNPHINKESYPGAFVYEPTPGIYNDITDFDFTSLYPSMIMTYNIGMNTFVMKLKDSQLGYELAYYPEKLPNEIEVIIDPMFKKEIKKIKKIELLNQIKESKLIHTINGCFFKSHDEELSIYSIVLENLISSRKEYKNKMFDAEQKDDKCKMDLYNTKQLVYKVLANSLYGAVANKVFRFFDISCAGAITLGGQEALKWSIIEGNSFMSHLNTNNKYEPSENLTKIEMFDNYELNKRNTPYIITGDTDSIFCFFGNFKGDKSVDTIKEYCDEIQTFLNNDIIPNKVSKHNVDLKFNKLVLKNELIISRGLFLAKKRYAIRVINNEGNEVDKINYMGIEIKRSDYPSKTKEFLIELLDLILKSKKISLPELFRFVSSKEEEFIKLIKNGDKCICRPVTYGKKLKEYKVLTQGIRSILAWNKIVRESHVVGSRGHMIRVSGIDEQKAPKEIMKRYMKFIDEGNKLEVVCIPDDESKLPDYFVPDLKSNLKFSFIDRYEIILKPLNEVKKTKSLLLI